VLTVTLARADEYESLYACDPLATKSPTRREEIAHALTAHTCYVAQEKGMPVGYAIFDCSFFGYPFIRLLMVHPEHRRQGIGVTLIRAIESLCPTNKLFTSTNQSNVIMQQLCEKLGFVRSGIIENLDDGDPEIIYFKRLSEPPAPSTP
jgi:GNAT superfamily N-acetyltransferase